MTSVTFRVIQLDRQSSLDDKEMITGFFSVAIGFRTIFLGIGCCFAKISQIFVW